MDLFGLCENNFTDELTKNGNFGCTVGKLRGKQKLYIVHGSLRVKD
jgi:hypothetical protein